MTVEMAALGVLVLAAALLVTLVLIGRRRARDFDQPIILPPIPEPYSARHSTDGFTTRLNPPPMRPRN